MSISKKASLIIYRFKEKGLEIFLVNSSTEGEEWGIPEGQLYMQGTQPLMDEDRLIALDPVEKTKGEMEEALAVEGDWHEIPSLKGMLYEDALQLKGKLEDIEKGTFFAVKEAFKKVLPHQYKFLKELKDVLLDRNSIKDL